MSDLIKFLLRYDSFTMLLFQKLAAYKDNHSP